MLFNLTNQDEEKIKLGYKFKVISNMIDFKPVYFKEKSNAELYRDELYGRWKLINVYVMVIDLEDN